MSTRADVEAIRMGVREKFDDVYQVLGGLSGPRDTSVSRSTSSGVVSLDAALGGCLPSGAVEIYGGPSSGKTTLVNEIIATAQKSDMLVALCPSEYLDIPYMRGHGVDLNSLILITGNCGEDVLEGALDFFAAHRDAPTVLAIDSATSLRPEHDDPGNWTLMLDSFLTAALEEMSRGSCAILVNQVRAKRSLDPARFFLDGETTSTAKKILDLFSLRLELRRGESRDGEHEMIVDVVASAVSKPATVFKLPVIPGQGIDTMKDLLRFGLEAGVVTQAGAWFSVDQYRLGCGMQEAVKHLEENVSISSYLLDRVMVRA